MTNQQRYKLRFGLDKLNSVKAARALEHALDIRKFEIELYWKRAGYFWALIGVAFAGFFAILSADEMKFLNKQFYAYVIGIIGFVFTWAWFLANRGSKYWQENWENHVAMLENETIGPLFKTTLHRPKSDDWVENIITGPANFSVSKINQWVSMFTLLIWIVLIWQVLPEFAITFDLNDVSWSRVIVTTVGVLTCALMCREGRTYFGHQHHRMRTRKSRIL